MPLSHLLEDIDRAASRFRHRHRRSQRDGEGPEPVAARNPGLLYGLGNLVDNAVDFAKSQVRIAADWTPEIVRINVADDGPGFSPDVIDRIGEPYVTTRRAARRRRSSRETLNMAASASASSSPRRCLNAPAQG